MRIEMGSKWVKDGEVVEFYYSTKYFDDEEFADNDVCDIVWFFDKQKSLHVLTERDFLEKYKPFQPVYEYQFLWKVKDGDCWDSVTAYHKDIQECINSECEEERGRYEYQRLDFTKRERKQ